MVYARFTFRHGVIFERLTVIGHQSIIEDFHVVPRGGFRTFQGLFFKFGRDRRRLQVGRSCGIRLSLLVFGDRRCFVFAVKSRRRFRRWQRRCKVRLLLLCRTASNNQAGGDGCSREPSAGGRLCIGCFPHNLDTSEMTKTKTSPLIKLWTTPTARLKATRVAAFSEETMALLKYFDEAC